MSANSLSKLEAERFQALLLAAEADDDLEWPEEFRQLVFESGNFISDIVYRPPVLGREDDDVEADIFTELSHLAHD